MRSWWRRRVPRRHGIRHVHGEFHEHVKGVAVVLVNKGVFQTLRWQAAVRDQLLYWRQMFTGSAPICSRFFVTGPIKKSIAFNRLFLKSDICVFFHSAKLRCSPWESVENPFSVPPENACYSETIHFLHFSFQTACYFFNSFIYFITSPEKTRSRQWKSQCQELKEC